MSNPQAEYNEDKAAEAKALSTGGPDTSRSPEVVDASPTSACSLCKHWRGSMGSQSGSCRRFPPQVIASQEYRWPVTAAASDCGEFVFDVRKQSLVPTVVKTSAEDEARTRKALQEALAAAEGEAPTPEPVAPVLDTTNPAPFINPPMAPKPLKPGVPKHIPVLTVAQARQFQGKK